MIKQVIPQRFSIALIFVVLLGLGSRSVQAQQTTADQPAAPRALTRPTALTRPVLTTDIPSTTATDDVVPPSVQRPLVRTQGLLVETLDGSIVMEQLADDTFNPASAIKLATALAALQTFGPEHRFTTAVWTNGTFDPTTGTITGDLIVSGRDPSFNYGHAVMLAHELNHQGIRTVTGDLIVAPRFTMNYDWSSQRSGDQLYDTLDAMRRPRAAARAWTEERLVMGDAASLQSVPSVAVMGAVYVEAAPPGARLLLTQNSSKLVDVLKVLLCYSNNFMAERVGDTLGGPAGVRQFLIKVVGLNPAEVQLASTSGLGINRVTPRAMMKIFRALRAELAKNNLSPADIMPVAGIDPGTLKKRYTADPSRGSVIAKTGTLVRTDGGASTLVGQMHTASGETLLFVIFNQRGSVVRFRQNQDVMVTSIQNSHGGPAPFAYRPLTLALRLADIQSKTSTLSRKDEYEPGAN